MDSKSLVEARGVDVGQRTTEPLCLLEGFATDRAPFFDGNDYVYWKTRMTAFLKCEAEEVWDAAETGPYIPVKMVNRKEVLKPKDEWSTHDKEMVRYKNKAMHILFVH